MNEDEKIEDETIVAKDLSDFTIVISMPNTSVCCFICYQCVATTERDGQTVILYEAEGSTCSGNHVETLEGAEVFLEGSIKWDGCADLRFSPTESCGAGYFHFCGRKSAARLGTLINQLYDLAQQRMPGWDMDD